MDDFDDDMTTISTAKQTRKKRTDHATEVAESETPIDTFDDDHTTLSRIGDDHDDLNDDDTEIVLRHSQPSASASGTLVDEPTTAKASPRRQLTSTGNQRDQGRPAASARCQQKQNKKPQRDRSTVSLRDRVPDTAAAWEPPRRPRSPEYQAPTLAPSAPWKTIAAALLASVILVAAAWFFLVRDTEADDDQPIVDADAESGLVDDR